MRAADSGTELPVDRPQSQVPAQRLTPPEPAPPSKTSASYRLRSSASQPVVASFLAGGIAGAVSRTVVSPLERLKILFQVQSAGRDAYQMSVGKALGKMWKEEGWKGFMAGNGTNCIRIVPYSATQFGAYYLYLPVGIPAPPRLLLTAAVLRRDPRCPAGPSEPPDLRRPRWHHLGDVHIPPRHRADTTLRSISVVQRIGRSKARGKAARHVWADGVHVQDRRRVDRALQGHRSDHHGRRSICALFRGARLC